MRKDIMKLQVRQVQWAGLLAALPPFQPIACALLQLLDELKIA